MAGTPNSFRADGGYNDINLRNRELSMSGMTAAARSLLVYSIYTTGLGATLLLVPNIPLPIFGLPEAHEVWIRVAGMTVLFLSGLYFIAARNEYRQIFVASVWFRFAVVGFFAAFAALGYTS